MRPPFLDTHLYNVIAVSDSTGAAVEHYEYADYGQPIDGATLAPIVGDPSSISNPYLFTGRRLDPESAFYYYRNRYMSAAHGRFISRDPARYTDGMNLYTYVGNSPTNFLDALGLVKGRFKELPMQAVPEIRDTVAMGKTILSRSFKCSPCKTKKAAKKDDCCYALEFTLNLSVQVFVELLTSKNGPPRGRPETQG